MRAALQQMLDSMPCGVLVLSSDQRIVMINPEGRKLLELGNARSESCASFRMSARSTLSCFPTSWTKNRQRGLHRFKSGTALAGDRAIGSCSALRRTEARPIRNSSLKSIWILRDVTAAKEAEQQREAARRNTVLAEISTILAHEIRNPLASLELFAGLIEKDQRSLVRMDLAPEGRHSDVIRNGE